MSKFINPFTDIGFKLIFGREAGKDLLITLLNELLAGEHHIEDLCLLDKEDHADNANDKGIIYDLYCRTSTGEFIIVEMQNRWHSHFLDRTLYYVAAPWDGRPNFLPSRRYFLRKVRLTDTMSANLPCPTAANTGYIPCMASS